MGHQSPRVFPKVSYLTCLSISGRKAGFLTVKKSNSRHPKDTSTAQKKSVGRWERLTTFAPVTASSPASRWLITAPYAKPVSLASTRSSTGWFARSCTGWLAWSVAAGLFNNDAVVTTFAGTAVAVQAWQTQLRHTQLRQTQLRQVQTGHADSAAFVAAFVAAVVCTLNRSVA